MLAWLNAIRPSLSGSGVEVFPPSGAAPSLKGPALDIDRAGSGVRERATITRHALAT